MVALGLNFVVGYTGLLSISHAAFFGIGAYATAITTTQYKLGFFTSMSIGILLAMFFGLIAGIILMRLKGDYYALGSISFNIIIFNILLNARGLTNGPLGISAIPKPELLNISFASSEYFLFLSLIILILLISISFYIARSPFSKILMSIREDEEAIQIFGYNTKKFKLLIFIISSAFASIAGSFFASYETFINPSMSLPIESIYILTMIIFGGLASIPGSILGAFLLVVIPEILRFVGFSAGIEAQLRQFIFGSLLIILVFYRPQGILGKFKL